MPLKPRLPSRASPPPQLPVSGHELVQSAYGVAHIAIRHVAPFCAVPLERMANPVNRAPSPANRLAAANSP